MDRIIGGSGSDVLTGGGLADTFVFNTALGADNIDRIRDFLVGVDKIELAASVFTAVAAAGGVTVEGFAIDSATTTDHHIIYKSGTGALLYDADGVGGEAAVRFARLESGLLIGALDFTVFFDV
jgi:Ca2+-binding RTX toxin-like protein